MSGSVELLLTWYWRSTIVSICVQILRIQPGRRCLGSQAKAKQSPRRTERRQKLKKATSRLIMNLIRKMSLSLRAVISSEGHLLRKQKLLSFLVITTEILICYLFSTTSDRKWWYYKQIFVWISTKYVALGLGCRSSSHIDYISLTASFVLVIKLMWQSC